MLTCSLSSHALRSAMFIALLLSGGTSAYSQTKLLRFPDISGDRVVFTYGGDLWTAPSSAVRPVG